MKVGFYETELTNPLETCLTGYFHRRPMSGVKERLFAKAVAVEKDGARFGIIAIDTCGMTDDVFEMIYSRAERLLDLPRKNILISCTHSHTGVLMRTASRIVNEDEAEECQYRAKLCADCLVLAFQSMQEATCRYGQGEQKEYAFVRNFLMKDGSYFTNPFPFDPNIDHPVGELDPSVNVLVFEGADRKPFGAIINYACHCDCVGGTECSGDFPAVMAKELKKVYGCDFVSLFVQGASGNINHLDVNSNVDYSVRYKEMGVALAKIVEGIIEDAAPLKDTSIVAAVKPVQLKKRQVPEEMLEDAREKVRTIPEPESDECNIAVPDDPVMIRNYAINLLNIYDSEGFKNKPYIETQVQVIRFGDCYFYGVPGELFNQYAFYIKEHAPTDRTFIAELSQPGYDGYIPIPELMESDNCYEGKYTSCTMAPGEGQVLAEAAVKLAKTL